MELKVFAQTDVGQKREQNEDNFLVEPELKLFIVADGMGGHAAGEIASQMAVNEVSRAVRAGEALIKTYVETPHPDGARQILALLEEAVETACAAIFARAQAEPDKRGMGTTTSALLICGDRGFIAHVGDSRVYLIRGDELHQLTEDHSLLNELVRRGKIKRDEIDASPYARYKNAVTRAVGANASVEADTFDFEVLAGDQFLLCSDGLYHYLNEAELPALFAPTGGGADPAQLPEKLIGIANAGGGDDNITAVVVRVEAQAGKSDRARANDLANRIEVLKRMPLFRHLGYKEVMRVLNVTQVRDYAAGETLIAEGSDGAELFIVLSGKIRLHKKEAFITYLERGAHIGEMALVDRGRRSASATAEEPSRVLLLRRSDFYEIIRKEPVLATKLLWSFVQVLNDRLRKTTADLSGARLEAQAIDLSAEVLFLEPPPPPPPKS